MREFKFRVYDNKDKEMFYSETYQKKTSIVFGLSNFLREISDIEDTLMQYTGLKDKNDVEIYEGDIVTHEDFKLPSEVIFERGCFRIHGFTIANFEAIHHMGKIEVIGNIYKNKDLLSEVK